MSEVRVAEHAGACYGVERALELAWDAVGSVEGGIFTLGPLIHNPRVVAGLEAMGAHVVSHVDDAAGGTLILRTHGVTPHEEQRAREVCAKVLDATCPFVKRVHIEAERLTRDGYEVVIVGESGHPEVVATLGHAPGAHIISAPEDVAYASLGDRVGIVVQTTLTEAVLKAVVDAIDDGTREVKLVNTICEATALRQAAASELARVSDAMVVIGGRNSANTTHLAEICGAICPRTFHIEDPEELDPGWFAGASAIGVTAGASTPSAQIAAVVETLERLP
ncbi:MAG: 4-hydroxy-3-methylbut-2-enyl diphosphate reductase [Coriobacteriaceae bacterium]|nr:4-hydroxy-3-methylbut-2-enyl diphosphate reductase [Coriobacteriaceae bacterium]